MSKFNNPFQKQSQNIIGTPDWQAKQEQIKKEKLFKDAEIVYNLFKEALGNLATDESKIQFVNQIKVLKTIEMAAFIELLLQRLKQSEGQAVQKLIEDNLKDKPFIEFLK